jgi:tetratricopeptide (TPR) repeat protein
MPSLRPTATILRTVLAAVAAAAAPLWGAQELSGVRIEAKPFLFQTDVGASQAEMRQTAQKFLKPILETAKHFTETYGMKDTCFEDYAAFYDRPTEHFEKYIRIHIWKNYDDFLADFQKRYQTKSIPGAFFGVQEEVDEYGKKTGNWIREIGTSTSGLDDMQTLRHLYHEMGHLFMRTFMVRPVEVPSWIEEGTAEHFQFRLGNGTKPEGERDEREGWLMEMVNEGGTIPWKDIISVKNMDNLDFTYKDPMRSQIQYVQAWSIIEFMLSNSQRQMAFVDLLRRFKAQAESRWIELAAQLKTPEDLVTKYQPYLYSIQEDTFKKCYGADLLAIEGMWKDWVKKTYEKDVVKKPALRYYRGEWYLLRARAPHKGESAKDLYAKADALFDDAIKQAPDKPEGYVGKGRIALSSGDITGAGEQFAKALKLGADSYDALLYAGVAAVLSGHCKDGIDPLTKAVTQRPTDETAQRYLGQALAAGGGDPAQALLHLRSARDLDANDAPNCAFIEGGVQFTTGHVSEAYISWLRCANLRPDYPMIAIYQALAKAEDNDRDMAAELLKPLAATVVGKAFLAAISDTSKPLPKISFTPDGWPTIDFAAVGLRTTKPGEKEGDKPTGKADGGGSEGGEQPPAPLFGNDQPEPKAEPKKDDGKK